MRTTSRAADRGRAVAAKFLIPFLQFVAGLGGQVVFWTGDVAQYRVHGAFGVGVSPASNLTTNLPQSVVTSFDKVFVENLKAETPWVRCTSRRMLDENSGNKLALFMYQNLPAPPLTQAPEGTIQTGITVTVVQNTSTVGNYADYAKVIYRLTRCKPPSTPRSKRWASRWLTARRRSSTSSSRTPPMARA